MKIKLILFGEAVAIPKTALSLGVGLITVFIDNNGFESSSNDIGTLGYVFIETQEVDLGQAEADKQQLFADLTNRVITFSIKPNLFVKSGGIVHISLTISTQDGGALTNHTIEYIAEDCTGIALVADAITFSTSMSPMETKLADLDDGEVVGDDGVVAIADAAPEPDGSVPV